MILYIVTKENIILRVYYSKEPIEKIRKALASANCSDYDDIRIFEHGVTFSEIDESGYFLGTRRPFNGMLFVESIPEYREN